jgi:uncharacterized beta-barrel protein YwiB (DUF1934 family)
VYNVLISVISRQVDAEGEINEMELTTPGKFYEKAGCRYITYKETEISGLGETTTVVKIDPGRVSVIRMGCLEAKQVFSVGEKHDSSYIMPYGTLEIGVTPWVVEARVDEQEGEIRLEYDWEIDRKLHSRNTLLIKIKGTGQ